MWRIIFVLSLIFISPGQSSRSIAQVRLMAAPDVAQQDFQRAKSLFQIGEIGASARSLESLIKAHPRSEIGMDATLFLGEIYLEQKQPDKALKLAMDYLSNETDAARLKRVAEFKLRVQKQLESAAPKSLDHNQTKTVPVISPVPAIKPIQEYPVSASTVGLILPLSGPYAAYGERALIAVQMAAGIPIVKFNGQPFMVQKNDKLTFVIGDSKGDAGTVGVLVQNLLSEHHVIAILGDILVDPSVALAKKAQELSVVNVSLSRSEGITDIGSWIFRLGLTTRKQTRALVERMMDTRSMKKFAVLYPTHPFGMEMKDSFVEEVKRRGGQISRVVSYRPDETTFAKYVDQFGHRVFAKNTNYMTCMQQAKVLTNATRIKAAEEKCKNLVSPTVDFDALFIPDFPKTVSYIVSTFVAQDFLVSQNEQMVNSYRKRTPDARSIQLLGPSSWSGDLLGQRLGEQMDGALFVDGVNWSNAHPQMPTFIAQYKQAARGDPTLIEAQAFDAVSLLRFLLENGVAKGTIRARQDLQKALLNTKNFAGLTGFISFDASRDSVIPLSWFGFEKGRSYGI